MSELSIKLKLGEREYPLKVESDEEQMIRLAGKLVNERIKAYRDKFGLDDKQDLFAMVAFDSMVEKLRSENNQNTLDQEVKKDLEQLDQLLTRAISI